MPMAHGRIARLRYYLRREGRVTCLGRGQAAQWKRVGKWEKEGNEVLPIETGNESGNGISRRGVFKTLESPRPAVVHSRLHGFTIPDPRSTLLHEHPLSEHSVLCIETRPQLRLPACCGRTLRR
jgi:hypothetical protein